MQEQLAHKPELVLLAPLSSLVLVRKELLRRRPPKGRQELMDKLVRRQQWLEEQELEWMFQ